MAAKSNNELLNFSMVPIAAILGAFILAGLLTVFLLHARVSNTQIEALGNRTADAIEFQLNQRQGNLMAQAESIATSILLSQLVTQNDESARSLEEARLRELIPNAIRVRLFPIGTARRDPTANPPFSFTSLDLVNRIESGLDVHPEAIKSGASWILSVAAPIKAPSDDVIRGTLFVYLDMTAINGGLEDFVEGEFKLIQEFPGVAASEILSIGGFGSADKEMLRKLQNPNWTLKYYPPTTPPPGTVTGIIEFMVPLFVFLLAAMGGIFAGTRNTLGKFTEDASLLANQMARVVSGEYQHTDKYSLTAFVDLDANLQRLGRKFEEKPNVEKLNVTLQPKEVPAKERVDIEDVESDEFEDIEDEEAETEAPEAAPDSRFDDPAIAEIFRAYDIRGIVDETLIEEVIKRIGLAIGSEAGSRGEQTLIVGADGRISSPIVAQALIEGLTESGRDVINIGAVSTPVLYYATNNSETRSGVMVTASHNPAEYNGFKIVFDGHSLTEEEIQQVYQRFVSGDFSSGEGSVTEIDITQDYVDAITDDVVVAQPLKVVIDCGNGIAGAIAPGLIEALGCDVVALYCDVDGSFPNHHPDPLVPANLKDLIAMVKSEGADLGIALDGDGDRLVAITAAGDIVWPDVLMMLFAKDVVARNPGSDVVYDVKCTRHLNSVISSFGGRPIICRSGHSFIKAKIAETGAVLGGEMSGHICFGERWFGFDDGLYSAARLLEIVGSQSEGLAEMLEEFPKSVSTPEITISIPDSQKFQVIDQFIKGADFEDASTTTIDGIRVDFSDGWGLVRASNTSPNITLRFEADDNEGLKRIQDDFRARLAAINKSLVF